MSALEGFPTAKSRKNNIYDFNNDSNDDEPIQPFRKNELLNKVPLNTPRTADESEKSTPRELKSTDEKRNNVLIIVAEESDTDSSDDEGENQSESEDSEVLTETEVYSKKAKKITDKNEYYHVEVGKATLISEPLTDEEKIMKGNLIENIMENLLITWKCYCPFELNTRQSKYTNIGTMYGRCLHSAHNAKFMINIVEIDKNVFTFTCYSSVNGQPECQKNIRVPVNIQNYRYEILNTEEFKNPPTSKPESIDLTDLTELWIESSQKPDGFVRYVGLPLTVVMYTKQQLKVVDNARTPNIVHLDATGAYVRPIPGLKKKYIFYYALVYRASISTIPLCEMITSEHDITSLSNLLKQYRAFVFSIEQKWPYFDAIVVDWSWASMHSILREWNHTDINVYLNDAYLYLTKGTRMPPMTLLLSCCAHIMHRVSRTVDSDFPRLQHNKGLVMEIMGLMIMIRKLEEMDTLFAFICDVFLEKDRGKCKERIESFLTERKIENTKMAKLMENFEVPQQNEETEMSWGEFARLFKKNPSICAKSPFYRRYYLLVEEKKDQMHSDATLKITNGLYFPQFIHYLLTTFMAYCPLWTAMMMDLLDREISRISNVYAESHMRTYKYWVLENKRRWPIGKVCRKLQENNENLVKENTLSKCELGKKLKGTQYDLYRKITENSLDGLMWNRKIISDDNEERKVRKRKIRHMDGKKILKLTEIPEEIEKISTPQEKIKATKKNKQQKKFAANDLSIENSELHKLLLLKNGLVNDVNYYANTKSLIIVIAYYYPTTENFILKKEMTMNGKQLRNLLYRRGSVDAETIDIFAAMNADKSKNIFYLSAEVANVVMKSKTDSNEQVHEKYYTKNNTSCGTILIPYCEQEHWRLLIVSETEKSIEILDPYNRVKDSTKITNALTSYFNKCNRQSNKKSMIAANWIVKIPRDRPLQKLTDKFNSAVYIMYYAQCIGRNLEMDKNLDPEKYRETIIHFIMEHSLGLEDKCLYCFQAIDTEKHIACIMCHRQVHNKCRRLDGMDTEDEEKVEYHEPPKKKNCSRNKRENYKCRLCRRYK